jgi:hypothetical protein
VNKKRKKRRKRYREKIQDILERQISEKGSIMVREKGMELMWHTNCETDSSSKYSTYNKYSTYSTYLFKIL